jgi:hypothetical protein
MGLSLQHLLWHADEENMPYIAVTGDESWVHHDQPKSKCASMNGNIPVHLQLKSFMGIPSTWNVMLAVFWDSQGVLLAHFQMCGENVNSASYCAVLLKIRDAICRKSRGQLARDTASS